MGFRRCLNGGSAEAERHSCSSSDSDYDEDEPRRFHVHIKPVQPREGGGSAGATVEQLRATVGTFILPPGVGVRLGGVGGGGGWEGAVLGLTTPVSRRAPSGGSRHVSVTSWCPPCLLLPPVPASPRPLTSPVPTSPNPPLSPCPSPGHTAALSAAPSAADPGGPQVPGEAVPGVPLSWGSRRPLSLHVPNRIPPPCR